jgi:flagellar biosynthesis regulator FlaF
MSRADIERAQQTDRRAIIEQARAKLTEVEAQLAAARFQRRVSTRIVYKVRENALIRSPERLRYRVIDS